jgi:sec-independent protein translocase protein TatC
MPDDPPDSFDSPRMTLGDHLEELRWRLIYALIGLGVGVAASTLFGSHLLELLKQTYVDVTADLDLDSQLVALTPTAALVTYLRVALIGGMLISAPWVLWQIWQFLASGLVEREKRAVRVAAPLCSLLFISGALFFLLGVSRPTLRFLLGFTAWLGLDPVISLDSHIRFMVRLMLAFGLAFQTPVVIFLLVWMGLVRLKTLARYRRHVILGFFVMAAMMTSPSPVDQIALAVPMWLLYELGMLMSWLLIVRPRRRADDDEADTTE